MFKATDTQGILSKTLVNDYLLTWLEAFIIDRKAQGVSKGTLHFYEVKFKFPRFGGDSFKLVANWSEKPPREELDQVAIQINIAYDRLWSSS